MNRLPVSVLTSITTTQKQKMYEKSSNTLLRLRISIGIRPLRLRLRLPIGTRLDDRGVETANALEPPILC